MSRNRSRIRGGRGKNNGAGNIDGYNVRRFSKDICVPGNGGSHVLARYQSNAGWPAGHGDGIHWDHRHNELIW